MSLIQKFRDSISSHTPGSYISSLEEIGWVAPLPDPHRISLTSRLEEAFEKDRTTAYLALGFDPGQEPENVLRSFAENSCGCFNPVKDTVKRDGDVLTISFRHKGRGYEGMANLPPWGREGGASPLLDTAPFAYLANRALEDTDEERRFIRLQNVGAGNFFVFVTGKVHELAQRRGLVPPDDFEFAYYR